MIPALRPVKVPSLPAPSFHAWGERLGVSLVLIMPFSKTGHPKELCGPGQVTLSLWASVASLVK